jgi:hypothetical protein
MTTATKPNQGQNVLVSLMHPITAPNGKTYRYIEAWYDAASNATAPWFLCNGKTIADAEVTGWATLAAVQALVWTH